MSNLTYLLANANANTVYNLTGCLSSCEKSEFRIRPTTELRYTVRVKQVFVIQLSNKLFQGAHDYFWLKLLLPTTEHAVKEQYVVYDGNSFVADVGGYLGLLLGHSLLGIYRDTITWTVLSFCRGGR